MGSRALVVPDHLPRRISNDGIEPSAFPRKSVLVVEHVRKLERPVKHAEFGRERSRDRRPSIDARVAERQVRFRQRIDRRGQLGGGRRTRVPEPSRAPEVTSQPPAIER